MLLYSCIPPDWQWSISSYIPVSDKSNWLTDFLLMNLSVIALVAVECYAAAMMDAKKHDEQCSVWVQYLIEASLLPVRMLSEGCCDERAGTVRSSSEASDIEMNPMGGSVQCSDAGDASSAIATESTSERKYSWKRGGRALDRVARTLVPTIYVIVLAVMLSAS